MTFRLSPIERIDRRRPAPTVYSFSQHSTPGRPAALAGGLPYRTANSMLFKFSESSSDELPDVTRTLVSEPFREIEIAPTFLAFAVFDRTQIVIACLNVSQYSVAVGPPPGGVVTRWNNVPCLSSSLRFRSMIFRIIRGSAYSSISARSRSRIRSSSRSSVNYFRRGNNSMLVRSRTHNEPRFETRLAVQ